MGGLGSGRYKRYHSKTTTERYMHLDVRLLRKRNALISGKNGTFTWSPGGKPMATIGFTIYEDSLILNYNDTLHGQDRSESINQVIYFDKTPCHYGGQRYWFICPDCGSRREILYLKDKAFICRKCADLNYPCQHEQPMHRLNGRARKIRHKLKTDWLDPDDLTIPALFKPKGMHESTFNRLRREQIQLLNRSGQMLLDKFSIDEMC